MRLAIAFLLLLLPIYAQTDGQASADPTTEDTESGFQWRSAFAQSALLLGVQHAGRMVEVKSRQEFGGPFWSDYFDSVTSMHTWNDSDHIATNYLGHPIMGALTGYIQVFNDPRGRKLEFDLSSKDYWKSRLKAMAWSAAYSAQFEVGPFSEASIGNVGIHPPTMAVVDLVVTPVGGFVVMLIEDCVDNRFVSRWERGGIKRARFYRTALSPGRSMANLLRWKLPWYRDNRPLG